MSIVTTTPTGNVGSRALQQVLKAGADVSVIVRQPEKLSDSIRSRVKVHQGSLTDAALVTKAFQGARAVLWLTPTDFTRPDVAAYHGGVGAAELLLETGWSGQKIRGLHGPTDLTFAGPAKILSDSIGKLVKHVQITPDQAYQSFLGLGASPGFAKVYVEMYQALAQPGAVAELRTGRTTTPTTLREWGDAVLRPLLAG